jgi:hypothetical protein
VAPAFPLRRRHEVLDRLPGDLAASAEEEEPGKQANGGEEEALLGEGARVRTSLLFGMVVVRARGRAAAAACCGVLYAVRSRGWVSRSRRAPREISATIFSFSRSGPRDLAAPPSSIAGIAPASWSKNVWMPSLLHSDCTCAYLLRPLVAVSTGIRFENSIGMVIPWNFVKFDKIWYNSVEFWRGFYVVEI